MTDSPHVPLPTFGPAERVCGNCKLWQAHSLNEAQRWVGPCRLQPNRGLFPPSAPICDAFVARESVTATANRVEEAVPRARSVRAVGPQIIRRGETAPTTAAAAPLTDAGPGELDMTRDELMTLVREVAGEPVAPPLAGKWEGGTIRLVPGKAELQAKDLPIDALFHKVVMVRDRLRTLEQKLNAHPKLSDAEKVEMQHYITRVYGSLTTFNVLFRDKDDQFVGAKGDE